MLLLVLLSIVAPAQKQGQALIDSLVRELPNTKEDTNKAALLEALSFTYAYVDPGRGIEWGHQALTLSEHLRWKKGMAVANADLAINYEQQSEHVKALDYNTIALKLYEETGNKKGQAAILSNMGVVYLAQSNYPKALECDFRALKINEETGDKMNEAITLENIGSAYFEQKNYSKTQEYYKNALEKYESLKDKPAMARCLGNLGIVLDAQGNYATALKYHFNALRTNEALDDKSSVQINLANIGYVYCHSRDYANALKYQGMALQMSRASGNKNAIAIDLGNIGETYFAMAIDTQRSSAKNKMANLHTSVDYLEKAVALCAEINFPAPQIEFSEYLAKAYSLSGDYKNAYEQHKQYAALKDSVFSTQNKLRVAGLEAARAEDLRIKEQRIARLEQLQNREERVLYIVTTILLLLVTCIVFWAMYTYRRSNSKLLREKKRHLAIIEKQVKHIRTQADTLDEIAHMQSHDIRGPVATILGLAQLFNYKDLTDPVNAVVLTGITDVTEKLDVAVQEVIRKKENNGNS